MYTPNLRVLRHKLVFPVKIAPDRGDKLGDAARPGVVRLEPVESLGGRVEHRLRGMEVGLADVEPQELPARGLDLLRLGAHHHRRYERLLALEPLHALRLCEESAQHLEADLLVHALLLALADDDPHKGVLHPGVFGGERPLDLRRSYLLGEVVSRRYQVDYLLGHVGDLLPESCEFLV
jgi:hypothetical protein